MRLAALRDTGGLAGSTLVVLAGSGVAVVASLALRMILARVLPPAELGLLLLAIAIVTALGGVASLGLNVVASREVAALRSQGDGWGARRLSASVARWAAVSGLGAAAVLVAVAPVLGGVLVEGGGRGDLTALLRALAPVVLGLSLGLAGLGIYRAHGGVLARAVLRDGGGGLLRTGAVVGAALLWSTEPVALAAAFSAAVLLSEAVFLAHAVRRVRSEERAETGEARPRPEGNSPPNLSLQRVAPFAGLEVLAQGHQWFDVLLLGLFVTPAELALYTVARSLVRGLDLARIAAAHRFLPLVSAEVAAGRLGRLDSWVGQARRPVLLLLAVPSTVAILLPGSLLVLFFGAPYRAASTVLALLTLAVLLEAFFGFHELVVLAHGREDWVLRLRVVCLGVGAMLLGLLAHRFGIVGAAAAVLLAGGVRCLGLLLLARRVDGTEASRGD